MAGYEHLLKSYDVADLLDDIASADPPAYLRRCFAEGTSSPKLSWARVQELAVCAMILETIVDGRDNAIFEHELIDDWRVHYRLACAGLKDLCLQALHRVLERERPEDPDAASELEALAAQLAGA